MNKKLIKCKYLITGGSGFIGSYLANILQNINKSEIYILDIKKPPIYLSKKIIYKKIDILNEKKLIKTINLINPHYVIHLAARTDLDGQNLEAYHTNTRGVKNLIKALNSSNSIKRIIFTSSMLVSKIGYQQKHVRDYLPPNNYGLSKAIGEEIIWESKINASWCIIRPTSIWGPGFKIPYSKFFQLIFSGKYFHIGNTNVLKTYGYIGNTCHQIIKLLETRKDQFEKKVFYIGDSNNYNLRNWADEIAFISNVKRIKTLPKNLVWIAAILGSFLKIFKIKFPITLFRFKNMTSNNKLDLSNINKICPQLPFTRKQGVANTVYWMRNKKFKNYKFFKSIIYPLD